MRKRCSKATRDLELWGEKRTDALWTELVTFECSTLIAPTRIPNEYCGMPSRIGVVKFRDSEQRARHARAT